MVYKGFYKRHQKPSCVSLNLDDLNRTGSTNRINRTKLTAIDQLKFFCQTQSKLNRILPRFLDSIDSIEDIELNRRTSNMIDGKSNAIDRKMSIESIEYYLEFLRSIEIRLRLVINFNRLNVFNLV